MFDIAIEGWRSFGMHKNEQRRIQFSPPDIGVKEINETINTLLSGWITSGPKKKELEGRLARFCDTEKVVCLSSATAAEELNLRILGVGPGDDVIVPAYTYTATASAAIHCGANVVFVDSMRDGSPITHSPEMDYDAMESAITERTKVVVPVDLAGIPCDYNRLYEALERKRKLFHPNGRLQNILGRVAAFSDSVHSLGAEWKGTKTGAIADFSSFSFHAVNVFKIEKDAEFCNKVLNNTRLAA